MKILVSSWEAVSAQAIVNCLGRLVSLLRLKMLLSDADDPFSILKKVYSSCMTLTQIWFQKVLLQKVSLMLTEVITTAPMITDDDMLRSVATNQQEQSDEDDDNNEEVEEATPKQLLRFQVESAIDVI